MPGEGIMNDKGNLLQRLVKYPLLLEQIAKYTDNSTGSSQVGIV